jgi:hypothetical protein
LQQEHHQQRACDLEAIERQQQRAGQQAFPVFRRDTFELSLPDADVLGAGPSVLPWIP